MTDLLDLKPLFLGLDVGAVESHYALTRDGANFIQGTVTLDTFQRFLEEHEPYAIGCEYTGRLAEPWIVTANDKGMRAYFLHSVERKALTRLNRQRTKTDKRDSKTIARSLYIYRTTALKEALGAEYEMFTDAESVKIAWTLRGMLSVVDKIIEQKKACGNRAKTAQRVGHSSIATMWDQMAESISEDVALQNALGYTHQHFGKEYELLKSIPGVGDRTATYIIAALMPVERFATIKHVLAYVGLDTRDTMTGGRAQKRSRMSRRGNPMLRGLLFMAAKSNWRLHDKAPNTLSRYCHTQLARGKRPKEAMYLTSDRVLRTAYGILVSGKPYYDPLKPVKPAPEAKPELPGHLITQAEYARKAGISRQLVSNRMKTGKLTVEEWQGKNYIVREQKG